MGQVVNTAGMKRVVDGNVRAYIEQAYGTYTRLLGRSPTFVTYYSLALASSGSDTNLGGAVELVGNESPVRYNSVENFPLYGITTATLTAALDDVQGVTTLDVGGDAVVIPNTLEPYENDFFVIQHLDTKLLFHVKSVQSDRVEGNVYYKLEYFLSHASVEEMLTNGQIDEALEFELANVGTDNKPIVNKELSLLLKELKQVNTRLQEAFWTAFYDRNSGTAVLRSFGPNGEPVYDHAMNLFVVKHDLLSSNEYLAGRKLHAEDLCDNGEYETFMYPQTIYGMLDDGSDAFAGGAVTVMNTPRLRITSRASVFFAGYVVSGILYAVYLPDVPVGTPGTYTVGGVNLLDQTTSVADEPPLRAAARRVLGYEWATPTRESVRSLISLMNDTKILRHRDDFYWLGPLMLYAAQKVLNEAYRTTD